MNRHLTIAAIMFLLCVRLRADVTITMTASVEAEGAVLLTEATAPRIVTRIKGTKTRTDVEVASHTLSRITDLTARQTTVLIAGRQISPPGEPLGVQADQSGKTAAPDVDVSLKSTGRSQRLIGHRCEEFRFTMSVNRLVQAGVAAARQGPNEVAKGLEDAKMVTKGVLWVARNGPGAAEYIAFQRALMAAKLSGVSSRATDPLSVNLDQLSWLFARAKGIPCLVEAESSLEGSSPVVDMLKLAMKVTNKVTEISVSPIAEDLFIVSADHIDPK